MSLNYQTDETTEEVIENPQSMPMPVYTIILCAAIVAVAVVQFVSGLGPSIERVGFDKPMFIAGQYWRILTGATVHGSIAHILMNSFALYSFGRIFEMLSSRAHLAIVMLLSAIGGGLLSLAFVPNGLSVGASGGIVGLVSYLAVYAFKRRQFISEDFRRSLLINIGFIIVFGLILSQLVDNFGHIGGLITGAVYGLLQIPGDEYADPREAGSVADLVGVICLGIYLAGCLFSVLLITNVV